MSFQRFLRTGLRKLLTKTNSVALHNKVPSLESRFEDVETLGLYLHVPFCRQICPYCPYNKEIYDADSARLYADAVKKEIDRYADLVGDSTVTSIYIGGGTPTTMLHNGLDDILAHVFRRFNVACGVHMESHPNDLSQNNLETIKALGVEHLSLGVEALQERHLQTLQRPYAVKEVRGAVQRAVSMGFRCVNADVLFALPHQTCDELEQTCSSLVELGVDQVAAYPVFTFPYTRWGQIARKEGSSPSLLQKRKMLRVAEGVFYGSGYERTSVWAFTRPGVPKYCSVTVPLYVGLGASGGSYLRDVFYLNTFNVGEYTRALGNDGSPIALSLELSEEMQMAGWLYWRIYETRFRKSDFAERFGRPFEQVYGSYAKLLSLIGFLEQNGDQIVLSDDGIYWLHVIQDLFSIDYVSKLWGTSQQDPWPDRVVL